MISLLLNEKDNHDLSILLASRRTKRIKNEIELLNDEIKFAINESDKIFESNKKTSNYIKEIYELDKEDSETKRNQLEKELQSYYETLPLEIREELEYIEKKISNRKKRKMNLQKTLDNLLSKYPDSLSVNPKELYNSIPVLKSIKNYIKPVKEEIVEEEDMSTNGLLVTRIYEAPKSLLNDNSEQETENQESTVINIEADNSFFGGDNPFEEEIVPIVSEYVEEENISEIFPPETNEKQEELINYVLEEGNTLASLAQLLCGDENGWYDIYEANKELLDARLNEYGISSMDNIENNENIFVGLSIVIPNEYNHINAEI